jgi:1-acyl-sn-glycerol-3-phosphate acyltransferase
MFLKIVRFISRLILRIIARVELNNFHKIPDVGACLVVSNHLGRLDAMLAMILTDREDVILMVADKYKAYAFWRFMVRQLDAIWLNRNEADFAAMRQVHRRLKAGGIAAIAPEGTRSTTEALLPGKPGAAYLATKANVPIIPVAIVGTEDRVVRHQLKRLRRLHIIIHTGDPFLLPQPERSRRDEMLAQATEEIMCRIGSMLPEQYRGVYAGHPRLQELQIRIAGD